MMTTTHGARRAAAHLRRGGIPSDAADEITAGYEMVHARE